MIHQTASNHCSLCHIYSNYDACMHITPPLLQLYIEYDDPIRARIQEVGSSQQCMGQPSDNGMYVCKMHTQTHTQAHTLMHMYTIACTHAHVYI